MSVPLPGEGVGGEMVKATFAWLGALQFVLLYENDDVCNGTDGLNRTISLPKFCAG